MISCLIKSLQVMLYYWKKLYTPVKILSLTKYIYIEAVSSEMVEEMLVGGGSQDTRRKARNFSKGSDKLSHTVGNFSSRIRNKEVRGAVICKTWLLSAMDPKTRNHTHCNFHLFMSVQMKTYVWLYCFSVQTHQYLIRCLLSFVKTINRIAVLYG